MLGPVLLTVAFLVLVYRKGAVKTVPENVDFRLEVPDSCSRYTAPLEVPLFSEIRICFSFFRWW